MWRPTYLLCEQENAIFESCLETEINLDSVYSLSLAPGNVDGISWTACREAHHKGSLTLKRGSEDILTVGTLDSWWTVALVFIRNWFCASTSVPTWDWCTFLHVYWTISAYNFKLGKYYIYFYSVEAKCLRQNGNGGGWLFSTHWKQLLGLTQLKTGWAEFMAPIFSDWQISLTVFQYF